MLNKVKILKFEVWDAETGESDVISELPNGKNIKAFSLDHFEEGEIDEVNFSLFCREFEIFEKVDKKELISNDENFDVTLKGVILSFEDNEETGLVLDIESDNVYIKVYISSEDSDLAFIKEGNYFVGHGRLDIEKPFTP